MYNTSCIVCFVRLSKYTQFFRKYLYWSRSAEEHTDRACTDSFRCSCCHSMSLACRHGRATDRHVGRVFYNLCPHTGTRLYITYLQSCYLQCTRMEHSREQYQYPSTSNFSWTPQEEAVTIIDSLLYGSFALWSPKLKRKHLWIIFPVRLDARLTSLN